MLLFDIDWFNQEHVLVSYICVLYNVPIDHSLRRICTRIVTLTSNKNKTVSVSRTISTQSLCHHSPFWSRFVTYAIFVIDKVLKTFLSLLIIIHMEPINPLDSFYKSKRNWYLSFGNLGIIFKSACAQHFRPERMVGNSARSEVTTWPPTWQSLIDAECFLQPHFIDLSHFSRSKCVTT